MSEQDFNISLKGNADAVYASLAKRKECLCEFSQT